VTAKYVFSKLGVFLGGIFSVHYVAKLIFALDLVLVDAGKIVFGKFEGDSKQDVERIQDLCMKRLKGCMKWVRDRSDCLTHFGKLLDLGETITDDLRVFVFKMFGEFWNVVHFDLVPQTRLLVETYALDQRGL
jgi:hypothetical protein